MSERNKLDELSETAAREIAHLREQLEQAQAERDEGMGGFPRDLTDVRRVEEGMTALSNDIDMIELVASLGARLEAAEAEREKFAEGLEMIAAWENTEVRSQAIEQLTPMQAYNKGWDEV